MQVPLQTAPSVQLEAGSEVQYGATNVKPQDDVVSDDIKRFGKAYQQLGQTINQLDDQLSDAEGKQLSNDYATELNALNNEYSNLKGVNAVGMVEVNGKQVSVFQQYQSRAKELYADYKGKASSGTVEYIFGQKASAYTRSFIDDITKHSLRQSRDYLEKETTQEITNSQEAAKTHYKTWNDPNGEFNKKWMSGLIQIQELAKLKGWNTDPNAIDPTDPKKERKLGVSSQYIAEVNKYNKNVLEGVIEKLRQDNNHTGAKAFLRSLNPNGESEDINELTKIVTAEHIEHNLIGDGKCVDSIISNNGNQNDGNVLSQMGTMLCLSSSQAHDNNNGGSVVDTLNSNEVDITERKQSENIDTLDKMRSTSKFYQPDSGVKLIPQHQTTHLFAISKLGVKQADSLYTKAKSSIEIDKERFKVDPKYAAEINGKIIDKYNELIIEASKKKYGNKEIPKLKEQIAGLEKAPNFYRPSTEGGPPSQSDIINMNKDLVKNKKLSELRAKLNKLEENDPKYVEKIENDLDIITSGIDYNYGSEESTIEVDEVTGLQPLAVLKAKLKATIKDPKELATATKDLEFKYKKLKAEREAAYNQALEQAQEIAFNPDGNGWKDLKAHNIDINNFTKADQEILRNGPPEESDKATVVKLEKNPTEVRDNLNAYRPKLSATQYLELKQYSDGLKADPSSVLAVTVENDMLDLSLKTFKFDRIRNQKDDRAKDDYLQIKQRWKELINEEQTRTGGKITRERKQALLNQVLSNTVMYDPGHVSWPWQPHGDDYLIPVSAAKEDLERAYVKVGGVKVMYSDINQFQRQMIIKKIRDKGEVPTAQRVAQIWVATGRSKIDTKFEWDKYNLEQEQLSSTSSLK